MQKRGITVKEFASRVSVSESYVYTHIRKGNIPKVPLPGSLVRVDWDAYQRQYHQPSTAQSSVTIKKDDRPVSHFKPSREERWLD